MKKLLSILIITTLTTSTPAPLLANTVQTRVKREVETTKTDVNTRVIKTDGANKPTAQQIKDKLKELNPQLDITKINVTNITHNSATITSNDENIYTKNVIVNYIVSISSLNW